MEKTNHLQGRQVSGGGKIIAFLFPFIGVIMYFVNKYSVTNPSAYLKFALAGFICGTLGTLLSMIMR